MARVHATAAVEAGAQLAPDVEVGAFVHVGAEVILEAGVVLLPHAVVAGRTRVGEGTRVHSFAAVGGSPQDRDFEGEPTVLEIGQGNVIREHVSIHVGSSQGPRGTRLGDRNYVLNGAHIGHDCQVGSDCVISSFAGLAGHVEVGDYAVLGAYTGVHQFARIGESVMSAANSKLSKDAPPFALVAGDRARLLGLNRVGLLRRGLDIGVRDALKRAFHLLFHSKLRMHLALERVRSEVPGVTEVDRLLEFIERSERGFCR